MSDYERHIDPELAAVLANLPERTVTDVAIRRQELARMLAMLSGNRVPDPRVTHQDWTAPGWPGDPDVRIRVYRPVATTGALPGLYWIHGGGHIAGSIDNDDFQCAELAIRHSCAVVSVEWRLSPENPYPAALHDAYAGLRWAVDQADEIGIDPDRLGIAGASSGGGLAAGLALMVRDRSELALSFQMLVYPMLDDRTVCSGRRIEYSKVWNSAANSLGWRSYLGQLFNSDKVPGYAAPARAADLSGLPPTSIFVGSLDLFADEDLEYARRLVAVDVAVELHVYPGAVHAFDVIAPSSRLSEQFRRDRDAVLDRALVRRSTLDGRSS